MGAQGKINSEWRVAKTGRKAVLQWMGRQEPCFIHVKIPCRTKRFSRLLVRAQWRSQNWFILNVSVSWPWKTPNREGHWGENDKAGMHTQVSERKVFLCVCGNYERLSDAMWWTRCTFKVSAGVILSTYTHAHSLVCSRKHSCSLDCKSCIGSAHRRPAHLGLMLPAQDTFPCAPSIPGWLPFQPAAQVSAPVVNTAVAEM